MRGLIGSLRVWSRGALGLVGRTWLCGLWANERAWGLVCESPQRARGRASLTCGSIYTTLMVRVTSWVFRQRQGGRPEMEWTGARYADKPTVQVETWVEASPAGVWELVADIEVMP